MNWKLVAYVTAGVTAGVAIARALFGFPWLVPALLTAGIALLGGAFLTWMLRPRGAGIDNAQGKPDS
jgi:hypothetical protein